MILPHSTGPNQSEYQKEEWRRYDGGIYPVVKTPVVRKSMVRVLEGAKDEGIRPSVFVLNSVHALAQSRHTSQMSCGTPTRISSSPKTGR